MIETLCARIARAVLTGVAVATVSVAPVRAQLIIPGFAVFPGGQEAISAYGRLATQNELLTCSNAQITAGGAIMFIGNPPTFTWVGGATAAGSFSVEGSDATTRTSSASLVVLGSGGAGVGYPAPQGNDLAIGQYTVRVQDPMPEDATSADALFDRVLGASARATYGISLTNVLKAPWPGAPLTLYGGGQATLSVPFQGGAPRRIYALLGIFTRQGRTHIAHVTVPDKAPTDTYVPEPPVGPNTPRPPIADGPRKESRPPIKMSRPPICRGLPPVQVSWLPGNPTLRPLTGEDGRGRPPATRREQPETSIPAPGAGSSASAQTKKETAQPSGTISISKPLIWFFQDLADRGKPVPFSPQWKKP